LAPVEPDTGVTSPELTPDHVVVKVIGALASAVPAAFLAVILTTTEDVVNGTLYVCAFDAVVVSVAV
jgi:hypothetical protein